MSSVLIVEDEQALNQAYQTILRKHGYDVAAASDGEEALAAVEQHAPDVILLDMKMPKMNGLEFLRQLAAKPVKPAIIIFSNYDIQAEIDEAFRLGARHYMLKAWAAPQELVRVVEAALKNEREEDAKDEA
jgi:CheY-like chemotaxis protein